MAATLDRPLYAVGDAQGTALGAAALGLVGLGRAADLTEALSLLSERGAAPAPRVSVDPDVVAAYARLRASVAERIAELEPVARLFGNAR